MAAKRNVFLVSCVLLLLLLLLLLNSTIGSLISPLLPPPPLPLKRMECLLGLGHEVQPGAVFTAALRVSVSYAVLSHVRGELSVEYYELLPTGSPKPFPQTANHDVSHRHKNHSQFQRSCRGAIHLGTACLRAGCQALQSSRGGSCVAMELPLRRRREGRKA